MRLTYIGHSTILIEIDGIRVLTDPVLRGRVAHLLRSAQRVDVSTIADVDVVLVSHLHHDHFDPSSLRLLDQRAKLIVPHGGGMAVRKLGFRSVTELREEERFNFDGLEVRATHAEHRKGRLLDRRSDAIGFTVAGSRRLYFAGDTDLFPAMRRLGGNLDLALLPVWGWGSRLGPGHLDPERAAQSLTLLEPRVAVPIHWGTLHRIGMRRSLRALAQEAPRAFARNAARHAPSVDVRILRPGEATTV